MPDIMFILTVELCIHLLHVGVNTVMQLTNL